MMIPNHPGYQIHNIYFHIAWYRCLSCFLLFMSCHVFDIGNKHPIEAATARTSPERIREDPRKTEAGEPVLYPTLRGVDADGEAKLGSQRIPLLLQSSSPWQLQTPVMIFLFLLAFTNIQSVMPLFS